MCLDSTRKDAVDMALDSGEPASKTPHSKEGGLQAEEESPRVHLCVAVFFWLATGTTISSLNKWIFHVYNFRYPLLLSAMHMLTAIGVVYPLLRCGWVKPKGEDEGLLPESARLKVFFLSLSFCASIAFGNLGLNHVQLSFAQMTYTTTPLFTLVLSRVLLGTRHHLLKYAAMVPICLGASFSILGEVEFHHAGCLFLFASTFLRGLKSIQQSCLLKEEKINSVTLLYLTSIPSFLILFLAAWFLEIGELWDTPARCDTRLWLFILLSCICSVLFNLAGVQVIALTSAVTIHVLGNLSLVGNLVLSRVLFGGILTPFSYAGIILALLGVFIYHNCDLLSSSWTMWRFRNWRNKVD
ncbi:solute carrier family 35 member E4 [Ambystoma mexicanum]|uniref:solute carrier family 35 member E4 n=1 Tax=Ambystoma mexicanum TaxID=8296 RepID=UPI0037E9C600